MKRKFAWSISSLQLFETCPKQYYHLRIKKDVASTQSSVGVYGDNGHKAIDKYIKTGKDVPLDFQYTKKFIEPYRKLVVNKPHGIEVLSEQRMSVNAAFEPTGWFDNDCWLRSIMDICVIGDKAATVVDWKFGKPKPSEDQLYLMAAVLMLHKKALDCVHSGYLWFKTKDQTKRTIHRAELPSFWAAILLRVKRMQRAEDTTDFPANPSGLCRGWCPVKTCVHYEDKR